LDKSSHTILPQHVVAYRSSSCDNYGLISYKRSVFVIWKLDLEFIFNSSFGSIKLCPLLLMGIFIISKTPTRYCHQGYGWMIGLQCGYFQYSYLLHMISKFCPGLSLAKKTVEMMIYLYNH
jgi:hypothetical protein